MISKASPTKKLFFPADILFATYFYEQACFLFSFIKEELIKMHPSLNFHA